jgi:hypothetical protein
MNDQIAAVDAQVVETPVVNPSLEALTSQETNFKGQLEQVKSDMIKLQQQFEALKTRGTKLEGALESLAILKTSLTK